MRCRYAFANRKNRTSVNRTGVNEEEETDNNEEDSEGEDSEAMDVDISGMSYSCNIINFKLIILRFLIF